MFSTKERDFSTGLDYFGFRYYDAVLGKFSTRDPSGYPDGPNNHLYVNNNPINCIDPLGLEMIYNDPVGNYDIQYTSSTDDNDNISYNIYISENMEAGTTSISFSSEKDATQAYFKLVDKLKKKSFNEFAQEVVDIAETAASFNPSVALYTAISGKSSIRGTELSTGARLLEGTGAILFTAKGGRVLASFTKDTAKARKFQKALSKAQSGKASDIDVIDLLLDAGLNDADTLKIMDELMSARFQKAGKESLENSKSQKLLSDGSSATDKVFNAERKINVTKSESAVWAGFSNAKKGRKTTGSGKKKQYFEWDHTHNDIEVYNSKGKHLGSMNPETGSMYKNAVNGRTIDL